MILTWLMNKRSQEGTGNILFTEIPDSNCSRCRLHVFSFYLWKWCDLPRVYTNCQFNQIPDPQPLLTSHHSYLIIATNISNKQEAWYCPISPLDVSLHNVDIVCTPLYSCTIEAVTVQHFSRQLLVNTTQLHSTTTNGFIPALNMTDHKIEKVQFHFNTRGNWHTWLNL